MPRERTMNVDKRKYSTPRPFYKRLDAVFGFTLDVCAEPVTAKCANYYTEEDNALIQNWGDNVCWMNPPYGNPEFPCKPNCKKKRCAERGYHSDQYIPGIETWVEKAWLSSINGATVVGLLPSSWSTQWWHKFVMQAQTLIIVEGRLRFEVPDPETGELMPIGTPDFDSIVAVWRPEKYRDPEASPFPSLTTMRAQL